MCGTNLEKQNNDSISVANKMVGGECWWYIVCILHSITYLSSAVILISVRAEASVVSPISDIGQGSTYFKYVLST
jgi:hypothetical protein